MGEKIVVLLGPEGNKFVLSQPPVLKQSLQYTIQTLLGRKALPTSEGEAHRKMKKLLMASFNADALKSCVPLMEQCALQTLNGWGEKGHVEVYPEMKQYTFHIIGEVLAGLPPGPEMESLRSHLDTWMRGLILTLPLNLPFTTFGKAMKARKEILQKLKKAVNARRANPGVHADLLARMLEASKADESGVFDEEAVLDNLLTMFFAGHDTSSSVLTNLVLLVSEHPDVLSKLREEHNKIADSKLGDKQLTWDDIKAMTYTDKVISEVMRLLPPVPQMLREAAKDFEYKGKFISVHDQRIRCFVPTPCRTLGYTIKKGWKVAYNIVYSANMEDTFPDSARFDPAHFDDPIKPWAYVPFGGGPRMCAGYEFARVEMKVFVHHLTRLYRWSLQEKENPLAYIPITRPINSLPILVVPLDHTAAA
eukprot:jgi/Chlat1/2872/Chrsp195S00206